MLALPKPGWLASVRSADPPSPQMLPAGSEIVVPDGQIAGALRLMSVDARRLKATYELLISNQTGLPLAAFAYGVGRPTAAGRLRWNTITVPALTSVAVPIGIDLPKRGSLRRVVAELHTDCAQLVVDAPPPRRGLPAAVWRSGLAMAGVLLAALGATGYAYERPRVTALAAPAHVRAGQAFDVAYSFGPGISHASYSVAGADGRDVAHGTANPHGGDLSLTLPARDGNERYDVRVQGDGPLGSAARSAGVVAMVPVPVYHAPVAAPTVRLDAVSLEHDVVQGGRPIVVHVDSNATVGTVKLLDQDGTERAAALLGPNGSTILIAPFVDSDQDFRVVIDARRGTAAAEKQLPVRIARQDAMIPPVDGPAPQADGTFPQTQSGIAGAPAGSQAAPAGAHSESVVAGGDPISLPKTVYRNGEPVIVNVSRSVANLRVLMLDGSGQAVQAVDVAPDETQVALTPPPVSTDSHFTIVASYSRGPSEESIIHSVLVRAR